MADNDKSIKEQRDKFLAFAFASADLLIEANENLEIIFSTGAVKGITGLDENEISSKKMNEMFNDEDNKKLQKYLINAKIGQRIGPNIFHIKHAKKEDIKTQVTLSFIKMPKGKKVYFNIAIPSDLIKLAINKQKNEDDKKAIFKSDLIRKKVEDSDGLVDAESFKDIAKEIFEYAKTENKNIDMALFDFGNTKEIEEKYGAKAWGKIKDSVDEILKSQSIAGASATEISDGKYSLIHDSSTDTDKIKNMIMKMSEDLDPEGKGLDISAKTIEINNDDVTEQEASRALIYTLSEFEKKGSDIDFANFKQGFSNFVSENTDKIATFKSYIKNLQFTLHFQPIINLKSKEASHYEALVRFPDGDSPYEWITFAEDLGLISEFDLAVLDRIMNYIKFKGSISSTSFAMNISGYSIQKEKFFDKMIEMLESAPGLEKKLMFEITESCNIKDLDRVAKYIDKIRSMGFKVALDDFGAGAASFQYLHKFNVDYVKIDGAYIRNLGKNERDTKLITGLINMCRDLGILTIAEMIEEKEQEEMLIKMNVTYGQGYLYGKPESKPNYNQPTWMK